MHSLPRETTLGPYPQKFLTLKNFLPRKTVEIWPPGERVAAPPRSRPLKFLTRAEGARVRLAEMLYLPQANPTFGPSSYPQKFSTSLCSFTLKNF